MQEYQLRHSVYIVLFLSHCPKLLQTWPFVEMSLISSLYTTLIPQPTSYHQSLRFIFALQRKEVKKKFGTDTILDDYKPPEVNRFQFRTRQ